MKQHNFCSKNILAFQHHLALVCDLGQDFNNVLRFYTVVETDIMPLVMQVMSPITGLDLALIHENGEWE